MSVSLSPPSAPTLIPANLAAIAAGLGAALKLAPVDSPPEGSRRYVRLLHTEVYEAWLIAWSPSVGLDLHDHGGSVGAVQVVRGTLAEAYTDFGHPEPLRRCTLDAGRVVAVPASRVHEVWNPGPADALSVHVYSPALTTMTFYDDDPARFLAPLGTREGDMAALEEPVMA